MQTDVLHITRSNKETSRSRNKKKITKLSLYVYLHSPFNFKLSEFCLVSTTLSKRCSIFFRKSISFFIERIHAHKLMFHGFLHGCYVQFYYLFKEN